MSLDNLLEPEIKVSLFGKEWPVSFTVRNFAAIKRIFDISEQSLMAGMGDGDIECIIAALWGSTLIFADFNPRNPICIKEQLDIEKLYSLNMEKLAEINNMLCEAVLRAMPKYEESEEANEPKKKQVGTGLFSIIPVRRFLEWMKKPFGIQH